MSEKPFTHKEEYIAEGRHKIIFKKGDAAVARYRENQTVLTDKQIKGVYYLRKILHLLMPENIPDIHLTTAKKARIVSEFIELDENHKTFSRLIGKKLRNQDLTPDEDRLLTNLSYNAQNNRDFIELRKRLEKILLNFDYGAINFGYNVKTGNPVYVENDPFPWAITDEREVCRRYKKKELLSLINELNPSARSQALSNLDRLSKLEEEDRMEQMGPTITIE
jgi:hypothetical protein